MSYTIKNFTALNAFQNEFEFSDRAEGDGGTSPGRLGADDIVRSKSLGTTVPVDSVAVQEVIKGYLKYASSLKTKNETGVIQNTSHDAGRYDVMAFSELQAAYGAMEKAKNSWFHVCEHLDAARSRLDSANYYCRDDGCTAKIAEQLPQANWDLRVASAGHCCHCTTAADGI